MDIQDLKTVIEARYANLGENGFGYLTERRELNYDRVKRFMPLVGEIFNRRKSINRNYGSYELKHIVEEHIGQYISNGELIACMILQGYEVRIIPETPNCYFNISQDFKTKTNYKY